MKNTHKNERPGMMHNPLSRNSNKFGFKDQSQFHQSEGRHEQDINKWSHDEDRDDRPRNYQSPNDGKSDWKNKSRSNQNFNTRSWDSDFGGDQDDRMLSKRMPNEFADSDLRTPNDTRPHPTDKDDRLNFNEPSSGTHSDRDMRNQRIDVDDRSWNSGGGARDDLDNNSRKRNWNGGPASNADNFSPDNPRFGNSRNRGRNWNGRGMRGRMR